MQDSLSSTASFPKELATTGELQLSRRDALKMTGRLFRLRMDVNLSSGILGERDWEERRKRADHRLRYTRALLVRGLALASVRGYSRLPRDRPTGTGAERSTGRHG